MSVRKQIVDALVARFEAISGVTTVDQWAVGSLGVSDLPAIVVRDADSSANSESMSETEHVAEINIDVLAEGDNAMDAVDAIVENVLLKIGEDETIGSLCEFCTLGGVAKSLEQQEDRIASANVVVSANYSTELWQF